MKIVDGFGVVGAQPFLLKSGAVEGCSDAVFEVGAVLLKVAGVGGFLEAVIAALPKHKPLRDI